MSAALQFPKPPDGESSCGLWRRIDRDAQHGKGEIDSAGLHPPSAPPVSLAFYRKHTQKLLRRYLYASMLVNRAPTVLTEPLMRGWASHQTVETFEDCVIFVLDVEKGLARLSSLERVLIQRVVLQEYSYAETAMLLKKSERMVCGCFLQGLDHLTDILLRQGTLVLPHQRPNAYLPEDKEG